MPWQTWLPANALHPARVEQLLGDVFGGWSSKWFASHSASIGELRRASGPDDPRVQWRAAGEGVAFGVQVGAEAKLAKLMLDSREEADTLTPRDREVTDQLANGCLDDLGARLAQTFGLPRDAAWRALYRAPELASPITCTIMIGGGSPLLRLAFESGLLADLVKAGLAQTGGASPLQSLEAGLAKQVVTLSAVLGRCQITLADLSGLTTGDVLVLDRPIQSRLDLAVNGAAKNGRCTVEHAGSSLTLKIVEPISG